MDRQPPKASVFPTLALIVLALGCFLSGTLHEGFTTNQEARVAVCAQGMLDSGDWVEPRLGEESRLVKPPLAYWLAAATGALFGRVTELAAKLPSVLTALGSCLVVFSLGRRVFDSRRAGFFAALILATTLTFWEMAHTAASDMIMNFFICLAVFGFWRVLEENRRGALDRALPWMALAMGFMAKGPVALAVPLLAVLGYLALTRRWRDMLELRPSLLALAGFVAVAVPWWLVLAARHSHIWAVWTHESVARLDAATKSHRHPSFFYYLLDTEKGHVRPGCIWSAMTPWFLLLPALAAAWWRRRGNIPRGLLLAAGWFGLGLVMFSLSYTKRIYYLMVLMPALALALGWLLDEFVEGRLTPRLEALVRAPLGLLGLVLAALPVAIWVGPQMVGERWPAGLELTTLSAVCLGAAGFIIILMCLFPGWWRPGRAPMAESALVAVACAFAWTGFAVLPMANAGRTPRDFVHQAAAALPEGERALTDEPLICYYLGARAEFSRAVSPVDVIKARPPGSSGYVLVHRNLLTRIRTAGIEAETVLEGQEWADGKLVLARWKAPGQSSGASSRDK